LATVALLHQFLVMVVITSKYDVDDLKGRIFVSLYKDEIVCDRIYSSLGGCQLLIIQRFGQF
jgi:hypothetical protein